MAQKTVECLILPRHLSPANQELVKAIPPKLYKDYERALDSVLRGQSKGLRPYNFGFRQTNLGHTDNMLIEGNRVISEYPEIGREVKRDEFQRQTVLHDGSESFPKAHLINEAGHKVDLPAAGDERDTEVARVMKRSESLYFVLCMAPHLPEGVRDSLKKSGLRYFRRASKDRETQFTKIVDGIEGTFEAGLDGIFSTFPLHGYNTPPTELVEHLGKTIPKTLAAFFNLARELPRQGRAALLDLADTNFKKLEAAGYDELTYYFRLMYEPLITHPY